MVEDTARHGLCLVAEGSLPDGAYLHRWRCTRADVARHERYVNIPEANFAFDEESESPDDYMKYCWLALKAETDDGVALAIMGFDYETSSTTCGHCRLLREFAAVISRRTRSRPPSNGFNRP